MALAGVLSKLIDDAVGRKQLHGFQVAEGGLMISHLQFADDTLLFVDANADEIRRLLLNLTSFEALTGMKLNLEKSSMVSVDADNSVKELALELGCKVEKLPIKYLSLPIGATTKCISVWDYVIRRMEDKLATWKRKFLSKAGRPKHMGGLGVKDLSCTSRALKAKWIWRSTRFWLDNWTSLGPIKNRYPAVYKASRNKTASVFEMISEGRLVCNSRRRLTQLEQMEWDMLCNELGPVHSLNGGEDQIDILDGFTAKKCYDWQMEDDTVWDFERFLWKKNIPPKVSFMLWANFHDSLPTRSMLKHRRVQVQDDKCLFCRQQEETADHLFVNCNYAREVWNHFIKAFKVSWVLPSSVRSHFEAWRFNNLTGKCRSVWWKVLYAVMWHLWKERGSRAFGGRTKEADELVFIIKQSIMLWLSDEKVFKDFTANQVLFHRDTVIHI
ncbi:uncharacterized protein LOC113353687 [Papaver somniferum]|uniref:uncharacterized protein LOC113353687 n=1 Tax=Papaver somniferum TaxID=3469 RepID=UPI000E6F7DE4|nr:uncharacterized protein LOC113353687 [Papaver somniferum]